MATTPWDAQGEARAALRTIVDDSRYGPAALSNAQTMTNLLKDMLPDAPRESSVLVAASEAGVVGILQTHLSNGMDLATASRLAAGSFENQTALTPEACHWAVGAFASALRLDAIRPVPVPAPVPAPVPVPDTTPPVSNGQQQTMTTSVIGTGTGVRPGPGISSQPLGLRAAPVVLVGIAAILFLWSCALTFSQGSGGQVSFFSVTGFGDSGTWWFVIGPIAVAILGIAAAILLLAARTEWVCGLAAGLLMAFGVSMILIYATYAFTQGPDDHPGPAESVGAFAGLLLVLAGVLAIIGRRRSAA
jgi:hypothetical protein